MPDPVAFVFDLLSFMAGGRDDHGDDLARLFLTAVAWALLLAGAVNARNRNALPRDSLLLAGFGIALLLEVFSFLLISLHYYSDFSTDVFRYFRDPVEHALHMFSSFLIAAAFLQFLLRSRTRARQYLVRSFSAVALYYLVVAPFWWFAARENPELAFSEHWGAWLSHVIGALFMLSAMILFMHVNSWMRFAIMSAMLMIFMEECLMLFNLATDQAYSYYLLPVRNNLHMWVTLLFGFIYWREQRDQHERLQSQLKQTERLEAVGQLAAGISHDFKNHLQVILGYAELGATHAEKQDVAQEAFGEIKTTVGRSVSLINQLLEFSRQEESTSKVIDLNKTLEAITPMLKRLIGAEYNIQFDLVTHPSYIIGSETDIEQIIVNLVVNARDAMPGGGDMKISTGHQPASGADATEAGSGNRVVCLEVADSGSGMSEQTLQHAYEPFFTTKPAGEGTGLGLSTVYGLVQKHRGSISIKSELDVGTVVTMKFDLQPSPDAASASVQQESGDKGSGVVLLAEDDAGVRQLMLEFLLDAGYEVIEVDNGDKAVRQMRHVDGAVDLMLFDVSMPVLNGYAAFDTVSLEYPEVPCCFVTADTSRTNQDRSYLPHLSKPFTRAQLIEFVRNNLAAVQNSGSDI